MSQAIPVFLRIAQALAPARDLHGGNPGGALGPVFVIASSVITRPPGGRIRIETFSSYHLTNPADPHLTWGANFGHAAAINCPASRIAAVGESWSDSLVGVGEDFP